MWKYLNRIFFFFYIQSLLISVINSTFKFYLVLLTDVEWLEFSFDKLDRLGFLEARFLEVLILDLEELLLEALLSDLISLSVFSSSLSGNKN